MFLTLIKRCYYNFIKIVLADVTLLICGQLFLLSNVCINAHCDVQFIFDMIYRVSKFSNILLSLHFLGFLIVCQGNVCSPVKLNSVHELNNGYPFPFVFTLCSSQ